MQKAPTTSVGPTRPRNVGPTNPEAPYKLTASPTPSGSALSSAFHLPVQVAISCVLRPYTFLATSTRPPTQNNPSHHHRPALPAQPRRTSSPVASAATSCSPPNTTAAAMAMEAAVAPEKSGGDGAAGAGVVVAAAAAQADRRSPFRRICVYCGSAKGRKPSYQDAAVELGRELVRNHTSPRKLFPPLRAGKHRKNRIFLGGIARVGPNFPRSALIAPLRPVRCQPRAAFSRAHVRAAKLARLSCPSGRGTERRRDSLPFHGLDVEMVVGS
jgi:hypothetical protein